MKSEKSSSFLRYCLSFITFKWLVRLSLIVLGAFLLLWMMVFALFQWYFSPHLAQYQTLLVQEFYQQTAHKITIGSLDVHWQIFVPKLTAQNIHILPTNQGSPLYLSQVEMIPSWKSLLTFSPRFSSIKIAAPKLEVVHTTQNDWRLNGLLLFKGPQNSKNSWGVLNDFLSQEYIQITQANISYEDQHLGLPKLQIENGNLIYRHGWFENTVKIEGILLQATQNFTLDASWRGSDANSWQQWQGKITSEIRTKKQQNFSQYFGSLVQKAAAEGDASLNIAFSHGDISQLTATFNLLNIALQDDTQHAVNMPKLSGQLEITRLRKQHYQIIANKLHFSTSAGVGLNEGQLVGQIKLGNDGFGQVKINEFALLALDPIVKLIGAQQNSVLGNLRPMGKVQELAASWQGSIIKPDHYTVTAQFTDVGWNEVDLVPGLNHASGNIRFDQRSGELKLRAQKSTLNYPRIFLQPIQFKELTANIHWARTPTKIQWQIKQIYFDNDDTKGQVSGTYQHIPKGLEGKNNLALMGKIDFLQAKAIANYLPKIVDNQTRAWLDQAFLAGSITEGMVKLTGDPLLFPFTTKKDGEFLVRAKTQGIDLRFLPEWPILKAISGQLEFKNAAMTIMASSGSSEQVQMKNIQVTMPNLKDTKDLWLQVTGDLSGDLAQLLAYTQKTPLVKWTDNLLNEVSGRGKARMHLGLEIPLHHAQSTKVTAKLQLDQNQVIFAKLPLPKLQNVNGELVFNRDAIAAKNVTAKVFGGKVRMQVKSAPNHIRDFKIEGTVNTAELLKYYMPTEQPILTGTSFYQAGFTLEQGLKNLWVKSDLQGTKLTLPIDESEFKPFNLKLIPGKTSTYLEIKLGQKNAANLRLRHGRLLNAAVGIRSVLPALPEKGVRLQLALPKINLDQWLNFANGASIKIRHDFYPIEFSVNTPNLSSQQIVFHDLAASGVMTHNKAITIDLKSNEAAGKLKYSTANRGSLVASLDYLNIDLEQQPSPKVLTDQVNCLVPQNLPKINATVANLWLNKRNFGTLSLDGMPNNKSYDFDQLSLKHQFALLTGELSFLAHPTSCISMQGGFNLHSNDFGGWLKALDLSEQIESGQADIQAQLKMNNLQQLSISQLNGTLEWRIKTGRFVNASLGLGKLLGLFDVRMLTRRFIFSFGDVFLPGLSFNTTSGSGTIDQGRLTTKNLTVHAPGVDAKIAGSVNLLARKLDLTLLTGPNLGVFDTGATVFNTLGKAKQQTMPDEMDEKNLKLFRQRYQITGSWDDPKISKIQSIPIKSSLR